MWLPLMTHLHHFLQLFKSVEVVYLTSNLYNYCIMQFLKKQENERSHLNIYKSAVSSRTIHNWLWIFLPFSFINAKRKYGRYLVWTLQCFACFFKIAFVFALENMKKPTSKVTHNRPQFFFSIANRPKISPNLIFCAKNSSLRDFYIMTFALHNTQPKNITKTL